MIWIYRLLLGLLSPAVLIFLLFEGRKRQGGGRYLRERLGLVDACGAPCDLWFHAASVGEVNAISPLIRYALERKRVLVTTNTPEAARLVERQFGKRITHCYCPVDFAWAMRAMVREYQPTHLFVVETELWPNLYRVCSESKIPVVIVNGRLSEKTLGANSFIKRYYRQALESVSEVWARSQLDADRFITLGCAADRIKVLGNIKFAGAAANAQQAAVDHLPNRPYVLAISTHDDEETRLASIWHRLEDAPLLVIIPRHPPRGDQVCKQLRGLGFEVAQRSRDEAVSEITQIYVADTLGEVNAFSLQASWVFMGGSLVSIGGHNMLEPASLGKAIVTGWHLENFRDEADYLLRRDAIWVARDSDELERQFAQLIGDDEARLNLEQHAAQAMAEASAVLKTYQAELSRVVD